LRIIAESIAAVEVSADAAFAKREIYEALERVRY